MYKNIGSKLKTLAIIVGFGGSGISLFIGLVIVLSSLSGGGRGYYQGYSDDVSNGMMCFFIMLLIAIVCFISSWVLYGFGQLIESTQNIEAKLLGYPQKIQQIKPVINAIVCKNCSAKNSADSSYCVSCGKPIR